jgi:predicted ester cyclase
MGIAPTNREVTMPFMAIYQIADGKIVGFWAQADTTSLMQQLGAMRAPSTMAA